MQHDELYSLKGGEVLIWIGLIIGHVLVVIGLIIIGLWMKKHGNPSHWMLYWAIWLILGGICFIANYMVNYIASYIGT
jgi:hypothetical protein